MGTISFYETLTELELSICAFRICFESGVGFHCCLKYYWYYFANHIIWYNIIHYKSSIWVVTFLEYQNSVFSFGPWLQVFSLQNLYFLNWAFLYDFLFLKYLQMLYWWQTDAASCTRPINIMFPITLIFGSCSYWCPVVKNCHFNHSTTK